MPRRSPRPARNVPRVLVFQFPASITSVVDAPPLVSSDASPTSSLPRRTVTSTPVAVGRVVAVGPAQRAHLAPPHPGHEEEPRDHGVDAAAPWSDSTPRPRGRGRW